MGLFLKIHSLVWWMCLSVLRSMSSDLKFQNTEISLWYFTLKFLSF